MQTHGVPDVLEDAVEDVVVVPAKDELAAAVVETVVVEVAVVVMVDPTLVAVEVDGSKLWDLGTFRSLGSR